MFKNNPFKLVPECRTVLSFTAEQDDDEGDDDRNCEVHLHLDSVITAIIPKLLHAG